MLSLLQWFADATEDPEKRKFVFSKQSFDKMESAADSAEWIKWLKAEIDRADHQAMAALRRELARQEPAENEGHDRKWRLRIRVCSNSHSVRPKALNDWNARVTWVKLYPVDKKKDQLLVEFTLPKKIPLQALWHLGLGFANTAVVALNIGTAGFFWWYMPEHVSRYYEKLVDLETDMLVGVERSPQLRIGWPNAALTTDLPNRVILCFAMLPQSDDRVKHEPFNHYLSGLSLLSKTDVFMSFEPQAYVAFLQALESGFSVYGDSSLGETFEESFHRNVGDFVPDESLRAKHLALRASYRNRSADPSRFTLTEVAEMKVICDGYFFKTFDRLAQQRAKSESGSRGAADAEQ